MRRFLKLRWAVTLFLGVSLLALWGFASGDSRSFQMAKNLDIFNSIVKELDLFYVDTIDPNKTVREGIDAMLYSEDVGGELRPVRDQRYGTPEWWALFRVDLSQTNLEDAIKLEQSLMG